MGNGCDGNVDLSVNPNAIPNPLNRDYYFCNLRLGAATLQTNNYRIFVRDTLDFNGGGISNNGGDGSATSGGAGAFIGTTGRGTSGGFGGNGEDSAFPNAGGSGGFGAFPPGAIYPFAPDSGGLVIFNSFPQNTTVHQLFGSAIYGGTGGGGDVSGGGGGGAGIIMIAAYRLTGSGFIQARGGAGSPSGNTGGGGGGAIIVDYVFKSTSSDIVMDVRGGTGSGSGTAGANGNIFVVKVEPPRLPAPCSNNPCRQNENTGPVGCCNGAFRNQQINRITRGNPNIAANLGLNNNQQMLF